MSRGQHHKRLAWVTGVGLGIAAVAGFSDAILPHGETLWHLVAGPEEDGLWEFQSIDGRDVSSVGYSVRVHWGEVGGGYNGCNSCSIAEDGARICTLQACAEHPTDALYRHFIRGPYGMEVDGDRMILTVPGHRAILYRSSERRI